MIAAPFSQAHGQTAPYVLPYTMSTFAGPSLPTTGTFTVGAPCGKLFALDSTGDGCLAQYVSIGSDPHDIRADAKGNVYWIDNSGHPLIHKISAETGLETVLVGSVALTKACATAANKIGDGCVSTDGVANSGPNLYTANFVKTRGLAVAPNGDVYDADYTSGEVHKINAATGVMTVVAGTGTGGYFDGPASTSQLYSPRGVGIDQNTGNVYIADTGNNVIRMVTPGGVVSSVTLQNGAIGGGCATGIVKVDASGVSAATSLLCAPEDVQVDPYGNIFITDTGNAQVRVIYGGKSTSFFGIPNPVAGFIYSVAGYNATASPSSATYPKDGTTPYILATTVTVSLRKIAVDNHGDLYIADAGSNVIWFVDHTTGYMRLLAGNYGATAGAAATGCAKQTDSLGDGCLGPQAALYNSSGSDAANGVDNLGNLYITDFEGSAAAGRLRKLLSGLNFPAVAAGSSYTQSVFIHFAVGDSQATTGAFTSSSSDFAVGTPSCGPANADNTYDCIVPITFQPSKPGNDTATLTVLSAKGGSTSYLLAGTGTVAAIVIDPGNAAALSLAPLTATKSAQGLILDGAGNAYIADTGNNRVLFYNAATSTPSVFAGTGTAGYTGDNGLATTATLKGPTALTIDSGGNVYIADSGNNVVRKVSITGVITTYAGGGAGTTAGTICAGSGGAAIDTLGDGCLATQGKLSNPSGLAADNLGQIYVSDTGNNLIRQINVDGIITVFAGGATTVCTAYTDTTGDGCAALQAQFNGPTGLAFDSTGTALLVADTGNNRIRRIGLATAFGYSGTGTATLVTGIQANPVSLIAGNGSSGGSVDVSGLATLSSLTAPTGVAVDAAENVYIADTGDGAVRLVNATSNAITTIVGINGTPGAGTVPGPATSAELLTPGGVAVTPAGTLFIADTGNNRILTDSRSQVSYNFGRTNIGFSSPAVTFTETSIGTTSALLPSPLYVASGGNAGVFSLTAPSGSTGCVASETLTAGSACILTGQFTPTVIGNNLSETYTETGAGSTANPSTPLAGGTPAITLVGTGAVLTQTTSTVAQTNPAAGTNSQFGASVTLTATVSATCNSAAPSCSPTGTVRIVVDGTAGGPITLSSALPPTASQVVSGLSVGPHVISCQYSGDNFYASSSCGNVTITVAQASTTSLLSVTNNNMPQYTTVVLTATVLSNTSGSPQGTVTFFANGVALSTPPPPTSINQPVNATTGTATLKLAVTLDTNGNVVACPVSTGTCGNTTLAPGTYTLTCTYNGASNFATSNCAPVTFTVVAQAPSFTLTARGCAALDLYETGTAVAGEGVAPTNSTTAGCLTGTEIMNLATGVPTIATAQGSTTDATIFINVTNTVAGTLTFSCSGLPQYSICTFSPTSITLAATAGVVAPVYTDVTMWTDIQPYAVTSSLAKPSLGNGSNGVRLAMIVGWPVTLLGLVGLFRLRRKPGTMRGLSLLALLLVLGGSSLVFTGCAGPGSYTPVLTPAGTYPVTVTVTGDGITKSTIVNFKVSSPGITGQE